MVARSLRLLTGLRAVRPGMLVLLVVLQLLLAALVPVSAWATGLVVAQANAEPVPATAFALVVFVLALWLGESVGHALWLLRAHVARAVDGAVRSEVRLLLSSAPPSIWWRSPKSATTSPTSCRPVGHEGMSSR